MSSLINRICLKRSSAVLPFPQEFNNGRLKKDCPKCVSGARFEGGVPQEEEFTPTQCVQRLKDKFGRKLFAVVDLSYTFRYYNSRVSHTLVSVCQCSVVRNRKRLLVGVVGEYCDYWIHVGTIIR